MHEQITLNTALKAHIMYTISETKLISVAHIQKTTSNGILLSASLFPAGTCQYIFCQEQTDWSVHTSGTWEQNHWLCLEIGSLQVKTSMMCMYEPWWENAAQCIVYMTWVDDLFGEEILDSRRNHGHKKTADESCLRLYLINSRALPSAAPWELHLSANLLLHSMDWIIMTSCHWFT